MKQDELKRFDMARKPMRTAWYLRPLTYILSAPDVKKHGAIIKKTGAEGLKPPYLLLCNHNAFFDMNDSIRQILRIGSDSAANVANTAVFRPTVRRCGLT